MTSTTRSQVLTTPPTVEPVEDLELAAHVRELDADQLPYLEAIGIAARQWVEEYCRRALITQSWQLTLDAFPCDASFLRIPKAPLQAVTSLKYLDSSGVLTTWDAANYTVDTASLPGRVHLAYGTSWPSTRSVANAVQVSFTAGYGDAAEDVPAPIKHAIKLLVGHYYQIREPAVTGTIITKVPFSVEALLGPYRLVEVG